MLPRAKRMREEEVRGALHGRRYASEYFSAAARPAGRAAYAVVVSKKVSPSSVVRHRIRRRTYAALAGAPPFGAIALFPKAAVAEIPFPKLARDLALLLSKMRRAA